MEDKISFYIQFTERRVFHMRYQVFFDLCADIYVVFLKLKNRPLPLFTDEYKQHLIRKARALLFGSENKIVRFDTIRFTKERCRDIIDICEKSDNPYFTFIVLCQLDSVVISSVLAHDYNFQSQSAAAKHFTALNGNYQETHTYILPKFPSAETLTTGTGKSGSPMTRTRNGFDRFSDPLNNSLQNIYCVPIDETLQQYTLRNVVLMPKSNGSNVFKIAFSPICNFPQKDILSFDYVPNPQNEDEPPDKPLYFENVKIKSAEEITKRCVQSLEKACMNNADMSVFTEMFGTDDLCDTDEVGFNQIYRSLCDAYDDRTPLVILPPTRWRNCTNILSPFFQTGEKIGEQPKQYPFSLEGPKGHYQENLQNTKQEILIIHIFGIGRFAFPICIDLLHDDYIEMLISTLKVNWLICPSFSPGTRDFESKIKLCNGLGTRCIWVNSCSALNGVPEPPDYIGLVATPVISSESTVKRITPQCNHACRGGCLFMLSIPLNCAGDSSHEDLLPQIEHLL